jgi:transposase
MMPPDNAVVLSVDEKPSIQALERAQGYLKLPNGRAMTGQSHDYKRHGTTTLFAALEVATGKVVGRHYRRRRRIEFLDFMNRVVAAYPDRELHVILDNLSTHKPRRDQWLARHRNVHFHCTPTHASWLNQIEVWFSILAARSLKGACFASRSELIAHIDSFIADYNEHADPFVWTKSAVHQKTLKPIFDSALAQEVERTRQSARRRRRGTTCFGLAISRRRSTAHWAAARRQRHAKPGWQRAWAWIAA